MSFQYTTCGKCFNSYEFYGRLVPPCPRCGYPEIKTAEEYYKSMGLRPEQENEDGTMRPQSGTSGKAVVPASE